MTMSKVDDIRGDNHVTNKRPSQSSPALIPAKTSTKPLTSFNIEDILGVTTPTKPAGHDTKHQKQRNHDDTHHDKTHHQDTHRTSKITRSTSPDLPDITQSSKDFSKPHYNSNTDSEDTSLANGKRRMQNTLHIFNSLAKSPRNGKTADDFRTATVAAAAAAAVASINPNTFFSSPFGCFPKTFLQGFIPAYNLSPNHLTPQHPHHPHQQTQHPHHLLSHTDHHPHHNHHHQQQQQQQHAPHSPTFLQGPVNLSLGNNSNSNHSNNNNNVKIVRPWDDSVSKQATPSPSPVSRTPPSMACISATTTTNSDDSYDEDEDEEISVDDEDPPAHTSGKKVKAANGDSVSPLDALMAMTSKTFAGLDNSGGGDPKRKDQAVLFGKHQPPKKRRKSRTAFTNQQIYELEKRFLYQKYLTPADRDEIAISLGLTNAQVITWFQNRRAKLKRDLEELKSDVTASKKLPIPRNISGSVTEIELRRIQERTLRESFTNGGLQSPSSSSMASLGDDHDITTHTHDVTTPTRDVTPPIHRSEKAESEKTEVDVMTPDPMDVEYSSEHSGGRLEGNLSLGNSSGVRNDNHDINENSNASLSPRESRENGGSVGSGCVGRYDNMDNQKNIGCFPLEVSPCLV